MRIWYLKKRKRLSTSGIGNGRSFYCPGFIPYLPWDLSGLRENLDEESVWHEVMRELFEKLLWEPALTDCHALHGHKLTGMEDVFPPTAIK